MLSIVDIKESKGPKLSAADRKFLTNKLYDLVTPNRRTRLFNSLAEMFDEIEKVLAQKNILFIQGDGTEGAGIISSNDKFAVLDIAYKASKEKSERGNYYIYTPIVNADLRIKWHKMKSGAWEVNVYIS